ncbi:hypothetical protein KOY48_04475 [Candidatus Minimicrobia naudis]|uniref:Uncharacterized protein n=1 Tax=Candidatus Minimicrobia naudis TaxID=2841263 RepID=A0A8F1MB10_9BACT|nr:hypothetical protein KOY48_04475 [Candidatus Minimicrobia naudis]
MTVFEKGDDLSQLINYDIIVSATGVRGLFKGQMIKTKEQSLLMRELLRKMEKLLAMYLKKCVSVMM